MQQTLARVLLIVLGALSVFGFFHEHLYELHVWSDAGARRAVVFALAWVAASGLVLWRWPGQLLRFASAAALLWAAWWAGPVAPLAVLYFLGSCYALGRWISQEANAISATLLGAGVWSRNGNVAYRMGRAIKAGRVWTNCYHAYPAHAAFGGYKESGIGRETHKVMLDHYQQTKNLLVSYSESKLGFF